MIVVDQRQVETGLRPCCFWVWYGLDCIPSVGFATGGNVGASSSMRGLESWRKPWFFTPSYPCGSSICSWAVGRSQIPCAWAIGFNVLVVLAYAGLIKNSSPVSMRAGHRRMALVDTQLKDDSGFARACLRAGLGVCWGGQRFHEPIRISAPHFGGAISGLLSRGGAACAGAVDTGQTVQFPAGLLQPFVTAEGTAGS